MTCKQEKHKQRFRFFFRSASPPFLFQICFTTDPSLVSVFFSFASGGWWWDQEAAGLWIFVRSAGGGVAVSPLQWKAGRRELSLLPTG
jgi:hypothetical protein